MKCQAMIWLGLGEETPCPNQAEKGKLYCKECREWKPIGKEPQ